MISKLISIVNALSNIGTKTIDNWDSILVETKSTQEVHGLILELIELLEEGINNEVLEVYFDDTVCDLSEELPQYLDVTDWKIIINKRSSVFQNDDIKHFFFLSKDALEKYLGEISPFHPDSIFNAYEKAIIFVPDLKNKLIGSCFSFLSPSDQFSESLRAENNLPVSSQIDEQIHFRSNGKLIVDPRRYEFDHQSIELPEFSLVKKLALRVLAVALCQEVYDNEEVLIDGIRRCRLPIGDEFENVKYADLYGSVKWAYEDTVRTDVRLQLIQERISIDSKPEASLFSNLASILPYALAQAKERFRFVIIERKDEALKELRLLLEDLRKQSDLYASKIRSFLGNFLRDALAAVVLISFSIFTKLDDLKKIENEKTIEYLFRGLAIYYVISLVFQLATNIWDIVSTKKEFNYWKRETQNLLPTDVFNKHVKENLKSRWWNLWVMGILIIVLYMIFILLVWQFPVFLKMLTSDEC